MKILYLSILLLGLFFSSAQADEVFLKQNVSVEGNYIHLSDIFTNIDSLEDKIIAPSPSPSRQSVFDYNTLSGIARRHNINWQANSEFDSVSVKRAFQSISSEEIIEAIKQSEFFSNSLTGDEIIESRSINSINIALDTDYKIQVISGNYTPNNNNFRAEINITEDNKVLENFRVVGKIYSVIEVPVLKNNLSIGSIIKEEDLKFIKVRSDDIKQKSITELHELLGKEAKRTLKPNSVLASNDIMTPILVSKSKIVKVIYKKKNMTLSYTGKALENGSMGEYIKFQPSSSTGVLQGTVIDTNTIMVGSGA